MRNQHSTILLRVNSACPVVPLYGVSPSVLLAGSAVPAGPTPPVLISLLRGLAQPGPPGLAGPFLGYRYAPGYQHAGAGPEWEGRRHALEAAFWAAHLQEFEACLARLRRIRGDARATRLVRDVLAEVEAAQGTEAALLERGLLLQRWRENAYGGGRERAAEGTVNCQASALSAEERAQRPPGRIAAIINRLPFSIESIIDWCMENQAVPITPFSRRFLKTKRRRSMLQKMTLVLSACLDWCQLKADGLVGVPHGSKRGTHETNYLPMTKNKRCDTEDGDPDYMYGVACLAGIGERLTYDILGFFRGLGVIEHTGHENHPNKDQHSIRISKYCIEMDMRSRLFNLCEVPTAFRDRYEKKNAKAIAKATREPAPPRPPLFRAGIPERISENVSDRVRQIKEALKSTAEKTVAEIYDELQAFGRSIMPQGP